MTVERHWSRLLSEAVGASSLEVFKAELELDNLYCTFQPRPFYDSVYKGFLQWEKKPLIMDFLKLNL